MAKARRKTGEQRTRTSTARERSALKRHAEACIDAFMQSVGYTDPSRQTDSHGVRCFQRGSASGFARVVETKDDVIFHTEAKVMDMPGDKDLVLPLFRELLELNLMLPGGMRLGIWNNQVVAGMTESARWLDDDQYGVCINRVMEFADAMDDKLEEKYGGTTQKRTSR